MVTNKDKIEKIKKDQENFEKKCARITTQEMINKFDKLCEEYAYEFIDAEMLRKEVIKTIDNFS